MAGRIRIWGGSAVAVAALVGLGVYFAAVGLEDADKLASVIGVFVGLAGLVVAVYGVVTDRRGDCTGEGGDGDGGRPGVTASGERSITIGGDNPGIASTGDGATNTQPR